MSPTSRVHTALGDHATPLPSVDDAPKRAAFPTVLADAEIVGLGEATHGTRECFQQKAQLIRWLVTEHDFRTVAFEADAAATTALDSFVRGEGADDSEQALAELDMWQWRTESVADLLGWLRRFNDDRPTEAQVRVRGVDLSTPSAPAAPLRAYFERVDPGVVKRAAFRTVASATVSDDPEERERALDEGSDAARTLRERVADSRASSPDASTAVSERTARHLCRVVEQACEWARVRHEQPGPHPEGMATRDRFMAENALWALEADAGNGVALWAHDGHVQRGTFDDGTLWADVTTMGDRLASELGDDYRPVGFDFARGSFRAVGAGSGTVETFSVGEPRADSATAAFAGVDDAPFLLDLDAAADDERLAAWLGDPRRKRYVGSVFDPEGDECEGDAETELPASFDSLLFLPESTPTRPVGGG